MPQMGPMSWVLIMALVLALTVSFTTLVYFSSSFKKTKVYALSVKKLYMWSW